MTSIGISLAGNLPYPGKCLSCGSAQRDCFNFPLTQVWNGAMLLCTDCMNFVAHQFQDIFDMVPAIQLESTLKQLAMARTKVRNFDKALSEFKDGVSGLYSDFERNLGGMSSSVPNGELSSSSNGAKELTEKLRSSVS